MKDLYSMFTFEPLHNLHLGVFILVKNCLIQHLSSGEAYSDPDGPSGKPKPLSLLKMSLLRALNDVFAHVEKIYALPGLHVNFAKEMKRHSLTVSLQ